MQNLEQITDIRFSFFSNSTEDGFVMHSVICRVFSMNCGVYWCKNIKQKHFQRVFSRFVYFRCVCHSCLTVKCKVITSKGSNCTFHHSFWVTESTKWILLQPLSSFHVVHKTIAYSPNVSSYKELPWFWNAFFCCFSVSRQLHSQCVQ